MNKMWHICNSISGLLHYLKLDSPRAYALLVSWLFWDKVLWYNRVYVVTPKGYITNWRYLDLVYCVSNSVEEKEMREMCDKLGI